jgi:hypothetical protein
VLESCVFTRLFGPNGGEVMEGWRKLHNEELFNLYSSSGITRMNKTRRMRCTGHEERNGRLIMCTKFRFET